MIIKLLLMNLFQVNKQHEYICGTIYHLSGCVGVPINIWVCSGVESMTSTRQRWTSQSPSE